MPHISYAFRDDAKTITMLTQGSTAACPLCQIVTLRRREFAPDFLDQVMALDVKGTNFPASAITEYGRSLSNPSDHRRYYAVIDSQIEFTVKPRTMQKIAEFLPAYTGTGLYNFFEGQPYGYLVVLKVFVTNHYCPDTLMAKGRMGSAQIIALYDEAGERTTHFVKDELKPLIDDGSFEYIKYEILHTLRVENSLIGVYGTDEDSKRLLKQKRDDYNDSTGQYKHTYNEDDDVDRAQVDYEETYTRVLQLAPTMQSFINYVRDIKPPQMVEWQTLLPRATSGDQQAWHRIIEMYLRNVVRIALYYSEKYNINIEDTIQDGIMGLSTAIDKFEESETDTFQQYYPLWVRQVIQREMPAYLYLRYFPIHIHEKLLVIKDLAAQQGLELPDDYQFVDDEFVNIVSNELEITTEAAQKYIRHYVPEISLEEYMEELTEAGIPLDDSLRYDGAEEMLENSQNKELSRVLNAALHTLTPREEQTLRLRFGFVDGRPRTLEEVGKEFNITRERVRQIEAKAFRKMRHPSRSKKIIGYLD